MEKDRIIIIALIAVLAMILVGIGYTLFNPTLEYQTLHLSNATTIEAPKTDDATWNQDPNGIRTFTCESKHTVLMSFNSQEDLNLVGAGAFAIARDVLLNGAKDVETYGEYQIKENTVNSTHYYIVYVSSNETHDNIVIGSDSLDILKHMLDSLLLGPPGDGPLNATHEETSVSVPSTNSANTTHNTNNNRYSEDDLMRASREGYYTGYSDALDDSYSYDSYDDYDYYDPDDSSVETTTYDSSSSSSYYGESSFD